MANPTNNNQPGVPPRPTPIGSQSETSRPAPQQQHQPPPADPLTKPALVEALGNAMVLDFNEGERSRDQLLKMLPKRIHHPQFGEVEIEYRSWNPQQAVEEPLYQWAKPVTREHFNQWIPDAYFAGAASPLLMGQTAGTLPSGRDQIWFWMPAKKSREMYARDMKLQDQKLKRLAHADKKQLDSGDGPYAGTYVSQDAAKIGSKEYGEISS